MGQATKKIEVSRDTRTAALAEAVHSFRLDFKCKVHPFGSWNGNDKHPLARGGVATATDDRAEIDQRFSNPRATGFAVYPGDFLVVDCDVSEGKDGIAELGKLAAAHGEKLPVTAFVTSPRGNGSGHLYFNIPEGAVIPSSNGKIAPGVDIRGNDGKYWIAGPGSRTSKGEYKWVRGPEQMIDAPAWLLEAIQLAAVGKPKQGSGKTRKTSNSGDAREDYGTPIDWDAE